MSKPGPKPSGVETAVLYKRLPKEDKQALSDLVDAALDGALAKWIESNEKFRVKSFKEKYGVDVSLASPDPSQSELDLARTVGFLNEARDFGHAMELEVKRLEGEVADLKTQLAAQTDKTERLFRMTPDEKFRALWRRFEQFKASIPARNEFDQG